MAEPFAPTPGYTGQARRQSEPTPDEHTLAWLRATTTNCPDCDSDDPEIRQRVGPITGPGPDEWFYVECQHPWFHDFPTKDDAKGSTPSEGA